MGCSKSKGVHNPEDLQNNCQVPVKKLSNNSQYNSPFKKMKTKIQFIPPLVSEGGVKNYDQHTYKDGEGSGQNRLISQKSGMSQDGSKKHKRQKKQYKFVKETIDSNENKQFLEVEEDVKYDENGTTNFQTQQNDDFTAQVIKIENRKNVQQQRISIENNNFIEKRQENKPQNQHSRSSSKVEQPSSIKEVKKMGSSIQRRQKSSKMSISESKNLISQRSSQFKEKNEQLININEEKQLVVKSLSKASSENFELKENQFFQQEENKTKQQIEQDDLKVEEIEDEGQLVKEDNKNNKLNENADDISHEKQMEEEEEEEEIVFNIDSKYQSNSKQISSQNQNQVAAIKQENQNKIKAKQIESNVIQNNLFADETINQVPPNKQLDSQNNESTTNNNKNTNQYQNQQSNSLTQTSEQNIIKNMNTIKSFNIIDEQTNNDMLAVESQIPLLTNQQLSKCEQLPEFFVDKCPEPSSIGSFINESSSPINSSNNDNLNNCKEDLISFELTTQKNNKNQLLPLNNNHKEQNLKMNDKIENINQDNYQDINQNHNKAQDLQKNQSQEEQQIMDNLNKQNNSQEKQTKDQKQVDVKDQEILQSQLNKENKNENVANQTIIIEKIETNQEINNKEQDYYNINLQDKQEQQSENQIKQKQLEAGGLEKQSVQQLNNQNENQEHRYINQLKEKLSENKIDSDQNFQKEEEEESSKTEEEEQQEIKKKKFILPQKKLTKMSQFYIHRKSISASFDSLEIKNEKEQQIASNNMQPGSSSLKNIIEMSSSEKSLIDIKNFKDAEFSLKSNKSSRKNSFNKQSVNKFSIFNEEKKQNDSADADANKSIDNQTQNKSEENIQKSSKILEDQVFKQILKKQVSQKNEKSSSPENIFEHEKENQNMEQKVMLQYQNEYIIQNTSVLNKESQEDRLKHQKDNQNEIDGGIFGKSEVLSLSQSLNQKEIYQENIINTNQNNNQHEDHVLDLKVQVKEQLTPENMVYLFQKLEQLKIQQEFIINSEKFIFQSHEVPPIKKTRTFSPNDIEIYHKNNKSGLIVLDQNNQKNAEMLDNNSENTMLSESQIKNLSSDILKKQTNCNFNRQSLSLEENLQIESKSQTSIRNFLKEKTNAQIQDENLKKSNLEIENKIIQCSQLTVKDKEEILSEKALQQIEYNQQTNRQLQSQNNNLTSLNNIVSFPPISIEIPLLIKSSSTQMTQNNQQNSNIDSVQEQGISISLPNKVISVNIQQIKQKYFKEIATSEQLFTDQEFPPCEESFTKNLNKFQRAKGLQWKRIKSFQESIKKHKQIGIYGQQNQISVKDTVQGWIANCYFVASLTCIAQYPQLVKKLFNFTEYEEDNKNLEKEDNQQKFDFSFQKNKNSCYSVNMCIDGQWQTVIIDDNLPCRKNDSDPIFCKFSNDTKAYWTCLLEKAYAKFKGCYSNIEGGKNKNGSSDAVVDMTGAPNKHIPFKNQNKEEIWKMIHEGKQKGYLFTTMLKDEIEENQIDQNDQQQPSNSNASLDGQAKQNGLISNHAYSILETDEVDGIKILKLKNPWGKTEWNGKWSDQCTLTWTEKLKEKHKLEVANDGIFWMSFCDYFENFCSLCVSYVNVNYSYSSLSFENNQQNEKQVNIYTIQPLEKPVEGYFILYQNREHLTDEYENNQYVNHLVKINEMSSDGKEIIKQVAQIYISTTKFAFTEVKFEPQKTYKIIIVTEKSSNIVISFYTNEIVPLSRKNLEIDCSQEILVQQAKLLAKKEKINPLYQIYWISFFCEQNHIVEIVNDTNNKIFSQNIKFILNNIEIDSQLKQNEYNNIKVLPKSTVRYTFKKINPKQQVQIQYSKYDPEFLDLQ